MKQWWYSEYNVLPSKHHLTVFFTYTLHIWIVLKMHILVCGKQSHLHEKRQHPYIIGTQSSLCTNYQSK